MNEKDQNLKSRLTNIIFIIIFFLVLIFPSLFRNRIQNKKAMYENRYLNTFPAVVDEEGKFNNSFFIDFDKWTMDNLWLRDKLIHIYNQFKYDVFNVIAKSNYFVLGKNKSVYYIGQQALKNFIGEKYVSDEVLNTNVDFVKKFDEMCKNIGVNFYYIQLLDKESVMTESFPKSVNKISNTNQIDVFVDKIKNETDVDVYYPKEFLKEQKYFYQIFPRNGDVTHWSERGAYITYVDFMKHISKKENYNYKILSESDFDIKKIISEANLYGGIKDNDEMETFYLKKTNAKKYDYIFNEEEKVDNFLRVRYENDTLPHGKNLLIIGDSYINFYWLWYMPESFKNLVYISFNDFDKLSNIIKTYDIDTIIWEQTGRQFHFYGEDYGSLSWYLDYVETDINLNGHNR